MEKTRLSLNRLSIFFRLYNYNIFQYNHYLLWNGIELENMSRNHFIKNESSSFHKVQKKSTLFDKRSQRKSTYTRKQRRAIQFQDQEWKSQLDQQARSQKPIWVVGDLSGISMYCRVDVSNYVYSKSQRVVFLRNIVTTNIVELLDKDLQIVAVLTTIYIPEWKRQRGLASDMISYIQKRVNELPFSLPLAVGPIFDETGAILKIVEKLGSYQKCMPWTLIQQFSV